MSVWFRTELKVLFMCFCAQSVVLMVPSRQAEGGCGELAVGRTVLRGTASGHCTHRLQRAGIHSQLSGATGPEERDNYLMSLHH